MKLPRIILNPAIRPWLLLWQRERRLNAQLRRELLEWQGKYLQTKGATPLFAPPPPKPEAVKRPPIGPSMKRAYLAEEDASRNNPTAEQVLGIQ